MPRLAWLLVIAVPVAYLGACSLISREKDRKFETISIGTTRDQVIAALGTPSVTEDRGHAGPGKYGARPCNEPCAQRLWFTNSLSFDLEAWSVELGADQQVIRKSHWVSP